MKLIINADDAGIDKFRNSGIFKCIDAGLVKSISVIVYQTGWADISDKIFGRDDIGVGLHLNLTSGRPMVENLKTIVNDRGFFFDKFELFKRAADGLIDYREVAREFAFQWDVLKRIGVKISHVDGHNHVHLFKGVREALPEVFLDATKVRLPFDKSKKAVDPSGVDLKAVYDDSEKLTGIFNSLALEAKELWKGYFRYADDFCGVDLTPAPTLEGFKKSVSGLQGGTCELMCHPGDAADEDSSWFSQLKERQTERDILTSKDFKEFLQNKSIETISYKDL